MSEQVPKLNSESSKNGSALGETKTLGELEAGKDIQGRDEFYHQLGDDLIQRYAGEVSEEDRAQLSTSVAQEIERVFRAEEYGTKQQQVKAIEKLILDLKAGSSTEEKVIEQTDEQENPTADETPTEKITAPGKEVEQYDPTNPNVKYKYKLRDYARMAVGLPLLAASTAWSIKSKFANKFAKAPDETEEAYKKRLNRSSLATLAIVGVAGAAWGAYKFYKGVEMNSGGYIADAPSGNGPTLEADQNGDGYVTRFEQELYNKTQARLQQERVGNFDANGDGVLDDSEILARRDSIIRAETEWFGQNGHEGNDFNSLSPKFDENGNLLNKDELLAELDTQYEMSPRMLASQLDQMQDHGVDFPAELDGLEHREGETDQEYMNRVSEAFYRDPELHDKARSFTMNFIDEHGEIKDLSNHKSDYVKRDEFGNVKIDEDDFVEGKPGAKVWALYGDSDPTNAGIKIQNAEGEGGCGQASENLPPQPTYQGTGGYTETTYGGQGGGSWNPPTGGNPPGGEGGTPPGGNPPGGEGGNPPTDNNGKKWNTLIDTEMDPAGPNERTEDFATSGNGTGSTSITGQEQLGSGNSGPAANGAEQGTGGGRTDTTGDHGPDAAEADGQQSHESATDQATGATGSATGTPTAPVTGRVN